MVVPVLHLDLNKVSTSMVGSTWLEILPVLSRPWGLSWLRPPGCESWRVPAAGGSIRQTVLRCLAERRLHVLVVHSTSWRQEPKEGAVVLTHLAVVRPLVGTVDGLEERPVVRRPLARGTPVCPPPHVGIEQVLEHALRHLAWLALDDREVGSALNAPWRRALRSYRPEPVRVFRVPCPPGWRRPGRRPSPEQEPGGPPAPPPPPGAAGPRLGLDQRRRNDQGRDRAPGSPANTM